ncbi:unnamed protein product [Discosporangium mesarthrocarpum]
MREFHGQYLWWVEWQDLMRPSFRIFVCVARGVVVGREMGSGGRSSLSSYGQGGIHTGEDGGERQGERKRLCIVSPPSMGGDWGEWGLDSPWAGRLETACRLLCKQLC